MGQKTNSVLPSRDIRVSQLVPCGTNMKVTIEHPQANNSSKTTTPATHECPHEHTNNPILPRRTKAVCQAGSRRILNIGSADAV